MKIEYFKDTDSMYIELVDKPATNTMEISEFVNADLDENNELVGLDIHGNASKLNLNELELKNVAQIRNIKFG